MKRWAVFSPYYAEGELAQLAKGVVPGNWSVNPATQVYSRDPFYRSNEWFGYDSEWAQGLEAEIGAEVQEALDAYQIYQERGCGRLMPDVMAVFFIKNM